MADLYKNKYRIPPARLQTWDYGSNGVYFITIVTKEREHFFGKIANGEMHLSHTGKCAEQYWIDIPNHFAFVELGCFTIMPNHMHGILIIAKEDDLGVETRHRLVSANSEKNEPPTKTIGQTRFQNQGKGTISAIVGSYKSAVSKSAHNSCPDFAWQTRFHDHIIRNPKSFDTIQNYIINNPGNWESDKFYGP